LEACAQEVGLGDSASSTGVADTFDARGLFDGFSRRSRALSAPLNGRHASATGASSCTFAAGLSTLGIMNVTLRAAVRSRRRHSDHRLDTPSRDVLASRANPPPERRDAVMDYRDYHHLVFERRPNGVVLITINRPEVLNATNDRLHWELTKVWLTRMPTIARASRW